MKTFPFSIGGMSAKHVQKILSTLPCHSTVFCFHVYVRAVFGFLFFSLLHPFLPLQKENIVRSVHAVYPRIAVLYQWKKCDKENM